MDFLSFSFFLFLTHSIENRCLKGTGSILFAGVAVHLSARTFFRLGQ